MEILYIDLDGGYIFNMLKILKLYLSNVHLLYINYSSTNYYWKNAVNLDKLI